MDGGGGREAAGLGVSWLRGVAELLAKFVGAVEEVTATREGDELATVATGVGNC